MSLGKKDIVNNISTKALFDSKISPIFFEKFLSIIKTNKNIKINKFGIFREHETKPRIGRNPLTKEQHPIPKIKKLSFRASNKVKSILN